MIDETEKGTFAVLQFGARDRAIPQYQFSTERPHWDQTDRNIDRVFLNGGLASLSVLRPEMAFTNLLDMTSLRGRFRLVALTKFLDPKDELREWWELGNAPYRGTQRFGDDDWDARTVCTEVSVAKNIFKDLFDYGELTEFSLAQMRSGWDPKPR